MEGFAAALMDGRPLPASSERLNERGTVITRLPSLLPEEGGRRKEDGGANESRSWMENEPWTTC